MSFRSLVTIACSLGCLAGAGAFAQSAKTQTYKGVAVTVLEYAHAKTYRDIKVPNAKKQDLLILKIQLRFSDKARSFMAPENKLRLRDEKGKSYAPALSFVQAFAAPGETETTTEIPFVVPAQMKPTSLLLETLIFYLDAPPAAAPQATATPQAK
ncbi:MAG: hypothetical protein MUF51_03405 [Vicinamibacteria bacterium]|nr:hypothetical protein [Vicinamibacteria bacterium]